IASLNLMKKMQSHFRVMSSLVLFSLAAFAQTDSARIAGLVTDVSGAVLPGATVTIKSEKTGDERKVTANDLGYYVVQNLVPGAQTAGSGSFDNIRFSGRANQQNEIRFDGVEASSVIDASPGNLNGETSTGFRLQSSLENIQEFRVESSNYPAEFGTGTGGQ